MVGDPPLCVRKGVGFGDGDEAVVYAGEVEGCLDGWGVGRVEISQKDWFGVEFGWEFHVWVAGFGALKKVPGCWDGVFRRE